MEPTNAQPAEFKDRKLGLVIFGVATVLLGCFAALLVPFMILASQMTVKTAGAPPTPNLLPIAALYLAVATVLIWLGVGSILARRWARALLVVSSWSWLAVGSVSIVMLIWMAPQITRAMQAAQPPGHAAPPGEVPAVLMLIPACIMGFLYFVLPLAWALFYSSRHVKATCEARDPVVRWTDRCPLPVLAGSVWQGAGALMMLMTPAIAAVAPFFGVLLSGAAAAAFFIIMAAVWGYCAWAFYRLDVRGWWVFIGAVILLTASTVITYSRHDLIEVYTVMGYPPAQVEELRRLGFASGSMLPWSSLLFFGPFFGYLLYVRKFFSHRVAV